MSAFSLTYIYNLVMQSLDEKRYYELAEKWLNGTINPEEETEFARWYNAGQDREIHIPAEFAGSEEALRERILLAIQQQKQPARAKVAPLFSRPLVRVAAAAIILLLAGGAWYYFAQQPARQVPIAQEGSSPARREHTVVTKAVLTLADGRQIDLDASQNGAIALQGGAEVIKSDSVLMYAKKGDHQELLYHTMTTRRGGQYQVLLEDGTRVWLNAASSIKFPTAFTGATRRVELTGEAYFEVAQNRKKPFTVITNGVEVEVLGTHFNVMAYQEEEEVKTTLLEGKVRVVNRGSAAGNRESAVLKPGEQAVFTHKSPLTVHNNIQTDEVIAWKNGLFQFEEADIRVVMREIERWYNVTVTYENTGKQKRVTGMLSRATGIGDMMNMLEYTAGIKYTMRGNRITISE